MLGLFCRFQTGVNCNLLLFSKGTSALVHFCFVVDRFELKQLLALYNGYVEFIEGSPVRQGDLERVNADEAAAFFLLADEESEVSLHFGLCDVLENVIVRKIQLLI